MGSTIVSGFRYRDSRAAIDWLCKAFGFARHAVYEDDKGGIVHAQLTLGAGMIMLGNGHQDDAYGRLLRSPAEVGGVTHSTYIIVPDADVVLQQVLALGADIVLPIHDAEYGGRHFTCRDPEGFVWSVGTYDPWGKPV